MSAEQTEVKKHVFRLIKVKLRAAVCWFPSWHQRSKGRSVTCFENIVRIRRLIYPKIFFARRVVEMIVLSQSIVWLVEAMYQSAFLEGCPIYTNWYDPCYSIFLFARLVRFVRVVKQWFTSRTVCELYIIRGTWAYVVSCIYNSTTRTTRTTRTSRETMVYESYGLWTAYH